MERRDDPLGEEVAQDVAALAGPFGFLGKRMYRAVAQEWSRNRSTALRAAERATGLSREQIEEWAEQEPRAIPLYLKVLWAAGMNGHDHTLAAMGAVLGAAARATAAGDDEGLETAELALRAMDELTPRHFRVLSAVADAKPVVTEEGRTNLAASTPKEVAGSTNMQADVAHQCLLNLAAAGLVVSTPVWDGTAYPVTVLGRAVVQAAAEAGQQA